MVLPVGTKVWRVNQGDKTVDKSWGEGTVVRIPECSLKEMARVCAFPNAQHCLGSKEIMMYTEELREIE